MRYESSEKLFMQPNTFNKDSGKEVLQYAIGGLLYMPASNEKIADKIISGQYSFVKSLVLDLEDALGDDMVKYGQRNILKIISELREAIEEGRLTYDNLPLIFLRVREHNQINDLADILGEDIRYITGFNVPKFDKTNCDEFIDSFKFIRERTHKKYGTDLYLMPIIESKHVMYRQLRMDNLLYINNAIRPIADYVLNIRVGGTDFCSIFGLRRPIDSTIYEIGPVGDCLNDILNVFAKSYIVSAPVWEYFGDDLDGLWVDGLLREVRADRLNGFFGKTCIHPNQLKVIQPTFIVSKEDYLDAMEILGMNTNTIGVKKSKLGCRMNEAKTHTNWARRIIGQANVYGVKE